MVKKYMLLNRLLLIFFLFSGCNILTNNPADDTYTPDSVFSDAFKNNKSNIQVKKEATIKSILSDDTDGDRHQRFIVILKNQQTLLIAHNIDIAPKVPGLVIGTSIRFYGEYEWNPEGGVIHWTHKDHDGKHVNGWLEYNEKRYE